MSEHKYCADFSLALINRTGAYYISRDVVTSLGSYFHTVRYWRAHFARSPEGIFRKVLGRLMLKEMDWLGPASKFLWPDAYRQGRLPTVFFDPLYVLRSRLHCEDIVLCHDVGPVSHPELFYPSTTRNYENAYAKIKMAHPGMVFVSESSKREFQQRYGSDFRFLQTIPLYARPATQLGDLASIEGISPPFLLTVAALEKRKNYLRVMEAYTQAALHKQGVSYVFCGSRGNATDEILAAAARTPGITALSLVSEQQLRWLYAKAAGFVLPSLLEGFGVPVLEAAAAGLVPLVSRGGAQEEAIGGNGILVDPTSVSSIAEGLETLVRMKDDERSTIILHAKSHAEGLTLNRFLRGWEGVLRGDGYPVAAMSSGGAFSR